MKQKLKCVHCGYIIKKDKIGLYETGWVHKRVPAGICNIAEPKDRGKPKKKRGDSK